MLNDPGCEVLTASDGPEEMKMHWANKNDLAPFMHIFTVFYGSELK